MTRKLWQDWIPGVLSETQLRLLCRDGYISGADLDAAIDPSSIDLTLADDGYEMVHGSVKPFGARYRQTLINNRLAKQLPKRKDGTYCLNPGRTYLFRLRENIATLAEGNFHGQATAKSSVGRVDVLARLIVDGMDRYEEFNPDRISGNKTNGEMYVEITPMSFQVIVKSGIPITQLRIFYCEPSSVEMRGKELCGTLLRRSDGEEVKEGYLCVDVNETEVWGKKCSAFCTKRGRFQPVKLWVQEPLPDAKRYWRIKKPDVFNGEKRFVIQKNVFYIMRSKELISLPPNIAVYCRANDETIGEMRIHYAGFVHPYFGYRKKDKTQGTPLIFELRGHSVSVNLGDGEKLCKLYFYRMSMDAKQPKKQEYGDQTLKLSKFFRQ